LNGGKTSVLVEVQQRPRICLIDVEERICESLRKSGFNCFVGTLGSLVEVPNHDSHDYHLCYPDPRFPVNLHEYDIVVIDLQNCKRAPYSAEDHTLLRGSDHTQLAFLSSFPQTLFDPRPLSASILRGGLKPLLQRETIFVVFAGENVTAEYHPVRIEYRNHVRLNPEKYSIYKFLDGMPSNQNMVGEDTSIAISRDTELGRVLHRHGKGAKYHIVFTHPTYWESNRCIKDSNFMPLMMAGEDQVVSFVRAAKKNHAFFFPEMEDKEAFVTDLLKHALPAIFPDVFPYSSTFAWLSGPAYRLPNEEDLLREKADLEAEYDNKLKQIDERIEANHQKYQYLHDLLTQSGSELVKTVERYFRWLGFADVVNCDEADPQVLEEDLQVTTERGLLVVEVKGIGGTSTDAECSQIAKVKYRRAKECGRFDVHAIYIVNHQRFLPPAERANPPFSVNQIKDAQNEERGLLTTYDLFRLHFSVEAGLITKEDARSALFQSGLVRFIPSNAVEVPTPYEIHHKGYVVVVRLEGISVERGMGIILEENGIYRKSTVEEIQIDGNSVDKAESGEVGIKLTERITKATKLWLVRPER